MGKKVLYFQEKKRPKDQNSGYNYEEPDFDLIINHEMWK